MKNYFQSENGHTTGNEAIRWANDFTETINQAYKKQMEMSTQFYNRIFNIPVAQNSTAWGENFWGIKVWTDYMNMAKRNLDIYTDWAKKAGDISVNSLEVEPVFLSKELLEKYVEKYEFQIQEIKDFNNLFIDSLTSAMNTSLSDKSKIISNFKKSTENNLDLFMNTVKAVLRPGNNNTLKEIDKQLKAISKLNFEIWADMVAMMTDASEKTTETKEEHDEKAVDELVKTAKQHQAKPEYHEFKSKKYNTKVNRVKPRVRVTHKK